MDGETLKLVGIGFASVASCVSAVITALVKRDARRSRENEERVANEQAEQNRRLKHIEDQTGQNGNSVTNLSRRVDEHVAHEERTLWPRLDRMNAGVENLAAEVAAMKARIPNGGELQRTVTLFGKVETQLDRLADHMETHQEEAHQRDLKIASNAKDIETLKRRQFGSRAALIRRKR